MNPLDRKFEETARNVERFARESPQAYRISVAALASLGYLYIVGVLVFALAVIAGVIFIIIGLKNSPGGDINAARFAIPMLVGLVTFIGSVLKALWVVIPAPTGTMLSRENAGRLYPFLDGISRTLKAPRFHQLLLSDEFNAGVTQVPSFGLIGPTRNYLMIGLPLMKALSVDQFRAVMAHELGHISGNHSRFSGWIYRQRETWMRVLLGVGHNWVFAPFLNWYAPYFFAYTIVLARSNEYVADRCAAEVVGAKVTAETLVAIAVQERYLQEKLWSAILRQARDQPRPVGRPYTSMFRYDSVPAPTQNEAANWLLQAWMVRTSLDETHPSLSDRLSALGYRGVAGGPLDPPKPPLPPPDPVQRSAADELLGPNCDKLAATMDAEWSRSIGPEWSKQHNEALKQRQRLEILIDRGGPEALSYEESLEYLQLLAFLEGSNKAVPAAKVIAQRFPRGAKAQAIAGMVLIESGDPGGVSLLENAGRIDSSVRIPTHLAVANFLRTQGKWADAHQYQLKARESAK